MISSLYRTLIPETRDYTTLSGQDYSTLCGQGDMLAYS